jgi:Tfp pilus assembly protein PilF
MDYFPNKPLNYLMYGMAQNELGNPTESQDYLQEGLMISANNLMLKSKIYAELARSYLLKNDTALAESNIDEALKLSNEKNPFAWEVKGDIMAHKGDTTKAQEYWNKAKSLGSTRASLLNKINQ